jgi:hypothetical protein
MIAVIAMKFIKLKSLELISLVDITIDSLQLISHFMPQLTFLRIDNCTNIDDDDILLLPETMENLVDVSCANS